jgi:hypothetical protein
MFKAHHLRELLLRSKEQKCVMLTVSFFYIVKSNGRGCTIKQTKKMIKERHLHIVRSLKISIFLLTTWHIKIVYYEHFYFQNCYNYLYCSMRPNIDIYDVSMIENYSVCIREIVLYPLVYSVRQ